MEELQYAIIQILLGAINILRSIIVLKDIHARTEIVSLGAKMICYAMVQQAMAVLIQIQDISVSKKKIVYAMEKQQKAAVRIHIAIKDNA